jgi:hypothetical protein
VLSWAWLLKRIARLREWFDYAAVGTLRFGKRLSRGRRSLSRRNKVVCVVGRMQICAGEEVVVLLYGLARRSVIFYGDFGLAAGVLL